MQRSVQQLALVGIVTAVIVWGPVALAASPAHPAAQGSPRATETQQEIAVETPAAPAVLDPICSDQAGGPLGTPVGLSFPELPQVGQPCCVTLCEAVCGVGEPCACKRCQVFGCGV